MALIQFVSERRQQEKTITGPFRPIGDQTKFRSIYGVVDGPQTGPWTGQQILAGEIYSADGKLRMGGDEVRGKDGKPHDVRSGTTTFREYQVPVEHIKKWNAYEAAQGNQTETAFVEAERAARGSGVVLEDEEPIVLEGSDPKFETASTGKTTVGWTPERREKQRQSLANARAAKAAKSQTQTAA